MKNKLVALLCALLASSSVMAKVDPNSIPAAAVEESSIQIKGSKITSASNPLKASVVTADGVVLDLPVNVTSKKTAEVYLPSILDTESKGLFGLTLRISGGDVSTSSPEAFVVLLAKRAANAPTSLPGNIVDTLPSIPGGTNDGIGVAGATGAQGPKGDAGTAGTTGPAGPQGQIGPTPVIFPGAGVVGDVNTAKIP